MACRNGARARVSTFFAVAVAVAAPLAGGCDPVLTLDATITVPVDVHALYIATAPGRVMVREPLTGMTLHIATLCDPDPSFSIAIPYDARDYGCVEDPSTFEAWIEAVPAGTTVDCGVLEVREEDYVAARDGDEPFASEPIWLDPDKNGPFGCSTAQEMLSVTLAIP